MIELGGELIDRDWRLQVDTLDVSALDLEFEIVKSTQPEPNTATIKILNLSAEHRHQLEALNIYDPRKTTGLKTVKSKDDVVRKGRTPKPGKIRVQLEAGYKGEGMRSLIFRGDLRRAVSTWSDGTWETVIEGEDGGGTWLDSRLSQSFPPGTSRYAVVEACAAALGIGLGNIIHHRKALNVTYSRGTTLSGQASTELAGVLRASGLKYSIQNGVIQIENVLEERAVPALYVSPTSGLVGRPAVESTGALLVRTLMLPNLAPGQYIGLQSKAHSGTFKITRDTIRGQTKGNDWYHDLECVAG